MGERRASLHDSPGSRQAISRMCGSGQNGSTKSGCRDFTSPHHHGTDVDVREVLQPAPESQLSQWQSRRSTDIQKEKGPNEKREPFRRRAPAAPLLGWPFSCESSRRLFGVGFPGQMRYWSVVFHVFACAFSFRFPTRIWSSHLMIFVRPIWSSLRLSCSNVLQSSIERSSSFSCEKQIVRLDPRSVLSRSDGSLLTGRRFVSFPSDDSYMRPHPESHQGENINLSTGHPLSGGKHLSIWWIKSSF